MPALSLAFWAISPWWSPSTLSRSGFVAGALVVFLALLVLRLLPRHEIPPPPGWAGAPPPVPRTAAGSPAFASAPGLLAAAAALALLAPGPLWRNPPGPRLAYQATAARLVLWRDGVPLSSEPLLPIGAFGAHAPAIATLSADVSRLCGLEPVRAVVLVLLLGAALAVLGALALCATRLAPAAAARAALLTLAAAAIPLALPPAWLDRWGVGEAIVALGFLLPSSVLLVAHKSRSSALAAAWLAGAGGLVQPWLAAASLLASARLAGARRTAAVGLGALAFAGPGLLRLASALSGAEVRAAVRSIASFDLVLPALGVLAVASGVALAMWPAPRQPATGANLVPALVATVALCGLAHAWIARGQLPEDAWRTLRRIEATTGPLDAACAGAPLRDWVPAVAGRAVAESGPVREPGPWIPAAYRDEWERRARRGCREGR